MAEMLMIILIVVALYCWIVPFVRAWRRRQWGWVVAIVLTGYLAGALYLLLGVQEDREPVRG
jgi:hypothetical protein